MTIETALAAGLDAAWRDKYDTAQLKAMKAKDETFPGTTSYPIADEEDLQNAIHAVGRGNSDHDSIRAYVMKRAKALGLAHLIPDNWAEDGSLTDKKAMWTDVETRASFQVLRDSLEAAICSSLPMSDGEPAYVWVQDFTDEWAIYSYGGELVQIDYTADDAGNVTLGDKTTVRPITTYVPVETKSKPTKQDSKVMAALLGMKAFLEKAQSAQAKDPDNKTDPDDVAVSAALAVIEHALMHGLVAQAKDGNDDVEAKSGRLPAVPKRAFSSLTERPTPNSTQFRFESEANDPSGVPFTGYASTTGTAYSVRDWLGEYDETIGQGSFAKTLREQESIPLLQNHDPNLVLANTSSGTSDLAEDKNGLRNIASINSEYTQLITGMRRKDINKMSFSFRAIKDEWNEDYTSRTVNELALYDTSIVTYPANPSTSAELLDEFRSALGREGVALAWSIRSALGGDGRIDEAAEPIVESVIRALGASDEALSRRSDHYALQGRARTFVVASLMESLRVGKPVSAKNLALVTAAMDAISDASSMHDKIVAAHASAVAALSSVVDSGGPKAGSSEDAATEDGGETKPPISGGDQGLSGDAGGGQDSGLTPGQDGLGPRSQIPAAVVKAQRELELLKLKR